MSSNPPTNNPGGADEYGYGGETASGYDDDYGNTTSDGYDDSTYDDSTYDNTTLPTTDTPFNEYADDPEDNARYNPGVGDRFDANPEDQPDADAPFNEYPDDPEDNARYNPGVGEQYEAATRPGMENPDAPPGTRQYSDYDYDYSADTNSYYDDQESVPLNPSFRSYDHFDRDAEFQDEYDSDEEEDDDYDKQSSFYKGREQYEYRNDEAEEERRVKKVKKRNKMDENVGKKIVAAVCCCCICIITILALLLVFLVFRDGESAEYGKSGGRGAPTPRPTPPLEGRDDILQPWIRVTEEPTVSPYPTNVASANPTNFPTGLPTPRPTISPAPTRPVPPTITLDATADTYVYVDGFFQYEAYGTEQSFLVQNGLAEYYEFADAMGLIQFDLSSLPTRIQMLDYEAQAILRLKHLPVNAKFAGREPGTISIRKLLSTPMRVETLHGGLIDRAPEGSIVGENTVTVGLNQDLVLVDVSDLLYPTNFTDFGYDRNQLLLMLFNNSTEQGDPKWTELEWQDQAGDRFKSVESGEGPSMTITYIPKVASESPSESPTQTP